MKYCVARILHAGSTLDRSHVDLIRQHFVILTDVIETKDGLLDMLCAERVLSRREFEEINLQNTGFDKNYTLLLMLSLKSSLDFEMFLTALRCSNQSHVADILGTQINRK